MLVKGKYYYNGVEIETVAVPEPKCDGCMFEYSVFGKDCGVVTKPECVGKLREDGKDVIFRQKEAKEVKRKNKRNGKLNSKPAERD